MKPSSLSLNLSQAHGISEPCRQITNISRVLNMSRFWTSMMSCLSLNASHSCHACLSFNLLHPFILLYSSRSWALRERIYCILLILFILKDKFFSVQGGGGIQASETKKSSSALFKLEWQQDGSVAFKANNGMNLIRNGGASSGLLVGASEDNVYIWIVSSQANCFGEIPILKIIIKSCLLKNLGSCSI